jgi:hypothetical protein
MRKKLIALVIALAAAAAVQGLFPSRSVAAQCHGFLSCCDGRCVCCPRPCPPAC